MRRILALAAVAAALPSAAAAQSLPVPDGVDIEVCWLGACNDVFFRAQTDINSPIFNPTGGNLVNSAGPVGTFFFDDLTGYMVFQVNQFPGAVFTGVYAGDCLTGNASDTGTYSFLGLFHSTTGCP